MKCAAIFVERVAAVREKLFQGRIVGKIAEVVGIADK